MAAGTLRVQVGKGKNLLAEILYDPIHEEHALRRAGELHERMKRPVRVLGPSGDVLKVYE